MMSKVFREFAAGQSLVEQSDRGFRCRWIQEHVTLRRRQVRVSYQLLDRRAL